MKTFFFTCISTILTLNFAWANLLPEIELSPDEIKTLNTREFVVKTKEFPGSAWPEITYYSLIEATPLEAAGIFAALDIQKDYVPNVVVSKPIKHITATDVHTTYELRVPFPLTNAHYTNGTRLYQYGDDFEVAWYFVDSSSTEDVQGSAYFKAYNGKTFLKYRTYVKPKSIFGGLVKKMMMKDVHKSVHAIRDFIEKNKREQSSLLTKYSEFITRALNGEFVYQALIEKSK